MQIPLYVPRSLMAASSRSDLDALGGAASKILSVIADLCRQRQHRRTFENGAIIVLK